VVVFNYCDITSVTESNFQHWSFLDAPETALEKTGSGIIMIQTVYSVGHGMIFVFLQDGRDAYRDFQFPHPKCYKLDVIVVVLFRGPVPCLKMKGFISCMWYNHGLKFHFISGK
jgi:hypothetical protein